MAKFNAGNLVTILDSNCSPLPVGSKGIVVGRDYNGGYKVRGIIENHSCYTDYWLFEHNQLAKISTWRCPFCGQLHEKSPDHREVEP